MRLLDESMLQAYEWRCIGPFRGGRATTAAGHPTEPLAAYFGACAGGVWKTEDGGMYWENVTDGFVQTASVGAIAESRSLRPTSSYAGMGETCIRSVATHGDGVYRSDDDGRTWTHLGLEDTRHIAKVRIHPRKPGRGVRCCPWAHIWPKLPSEGSFARWTAAQDLGAGVVQG